MLSIKEIKIPGYEKVIEGVDPSRNLHCYIAVHNTALGPSLGGTRIHSYSSSDEALQDVLDLAKAMTYKSAVVEDGLGGGKSVIIANPRKEKTRSLLLAFGEVVDYLKGSYIAAEDVGSGIDDMLVIREKTPYVAALPTESSSGDPSRFTARGVFRGIQAVAQKLWGSTNLQGKKIAVQGLGHVGSKLAEILFWEGAELIICDIDHNRAQAVAHACGAEIIEPSQFCKIECDILSPCAMGSVFSKENVPLLKCKAIAGGANNQLHTKDVAKILLDQGILYAPDFIINSGGIINAAAEFEPCGYDPQFSRDKVNQIYDTLLKVIERSQLENKSTNEIAYEIAEHNIANGIGKRCEPINFHR